MTTEQKIAEACEAHTAAIAAVDETYEVGTAVSTKAYMLATGEAYMTYRDQTAGFKKVSPDASKAYTLATDEDYAAYCAVTAEARKTRDDAIAKADETYDAAIAALTPANCLTPEQP